MTHREESARMVCRIIAIFGFTVPWLVGVVNCRNAAAEVGLEISFGEDVNAYRWNFFEFGEEIVISSLSPGNTQDSGFFESFDDLINDVVGRWSLTTDQGVVDFNLETFSASDFVVPNVSEPTEGMVVQSGELIPFSATAPGTEFISRGFFSNPDLTGEFVEGGFRATLNPGVTTSQFRVFAAGVNIIQATNVDDPNGVFDTEVFLAGESSPVSVTVTAIPEPSSLALLSLVTLASCPLLRRTRKANKS